MGIENITEKILADANDDARRIFEKGRYDGRGTIYRTERLIKQKQSDLEKKVKEDAETVKKRKHSVAELEARKMRLSAKQEAISRCFDAALSELSSLPEEQYIALLVKAVKETGAVKGEIMLTEKDRKKIGEKLIARIDGEIRGAALTLSGETIQAMGGFILKDGAVFINSTLEVLVAAIREEITPKVVETLFGERG